jgi:hypothetical protein
MTSGAIETFFRDGRWRNSIQTVRVLAMEYDTREEAVAAGRQLAREARVEHIVRNADGTIAAREAHGDNPRGTPD